MPTAFDGALVSAAFHLSGAIRAAAPAAPVDSARICALANSVLANRIIVQAGALGIRPFPFAVCYGVSVKLESPLALASSNGVSLCSSNLGAYLPLPCAYMNRPMVSKSTMQIEVPCPQI